MKLRPDLAAMFLLVTAAASPQDALAAPTCEQFKATITEGSALYHEPAPKFELMHVDAVDRNLQYFSVSMFKDARSIVSCQHGDVATFAVDADSTEPASVLHSMLLAGMGLHGYGLAWKDALETRDQLVRSAKKSDQSMSEVRVEDGKASLVISFAGVPSFEIDADR